MSEKENVMQPETGPHNKRQTLALAAVVLLGMASIVALSRYKDANRPPTDSSLEEEQLYLTGTAVKKMSLSFNGLVADWYWMRSLQYIGRKIDQYEGDIQLDNLRPLNMLLLYPLLDASTTIDPQFQEPYFYGAVVLPAINEEEAVKLVRKGIAADPTSWKLYHHLGYIYWTSKEYKQASEAYGEGGKLPGAPAWMKAMSALMASKGGSRDTAREIYKQLYEQSEDPQIKQLAEARLIQLASQDERDAIRRTLADFQSRNGRCATSWREIGPQLRASGFKFDSSGAPLDPSDAPYLLVKNGCDVDLDKTSKVLREVGQ